MLEATLNRVSDRRMFAPPIIVASLDLAGIIEDKGWAADAIIIAEPVGRNTAPAVALAAFNTAPDELLLVLPSDHLIKDAAAFESAVRAGVKPAEEGWFVIFGVKPERPETGYGYIRAGAPLSDGLFETREFVEKPDREQAAAYLADGSYFWNAGIFLFRAKDMREALAAYVPAVAAACRSAVQEQKQEGQRRLPSKSHFARCPAISLDYAVIEKVGKLAVVPSVLGWSDLGSWESLFEAEAANASENILSGKVVAKDVSGCLIRSDGPVIGAIAIRDLVVIAAQGAVLIVPREQSQRVKELVEAIGAAGFGSTGAVAAEIQGERLDG
jgi:mannose-1-phosphate guanylyltransferase/mannose-1-phosphate guanylyltransferase/mannose-6-phosphate isomerase